jgi:hypothetical protein
MVETARELGFAFMAGSSLPVTRRIPQVEMPLGSQLEEALCVCVGGIDSYDIHGLETLQCMVERREGGEVGVSSLQALRGEKVWEALQAGSWEAGGWDRELFEACLCRSHRLKPDREGYNHTYPTADQMPALTEQSPLVYSFQYGDCLKATMMLVEGLVHDFTFAARFKDSRELLSTQMYLPGGLAPANFFNPLVNNIEKMFLTGEPTYPVERTLLTTGLTAAGVESLWQGERLLETPHLDIRYHPTAESTFWRA